MKYHGKYVALDLFAVEAADAIMSRCLFFMIATFCVLLRDTKSALDRFDLDSSREIKVSIIPIVMIDIFLMFCSQNSRYIVSRFVSL